MRYNFSIEIITLRKDRTVKYGFLVNVNTNEGFINASNLIVSKMEELKLKYKMN